MYDEQAIRRYLNNVNKDGPIVNPSYGQCWGWTGSVIKGGYGQISMYGTTLLASRIAWALKSGSPPPNELYVCHVCDNPNCVRNDEHGIYVVEGIEYERWGHLFVAPPLANSRDIVAKEKLRRWPNGIAPWEI